MAQNIYTPQGKMRQGQGTLRPDVPVAPPQQIGLAELARRLPIRSQAILGGGQPMAPPMQDMGQGQYQQALEALRQIYGGGR